MQMVGIIFMVLVFLFCFFSLLIGDIKKGQYESKFLFMMIILSMVGGMIGGGIIYGISGQILYATSSKTDRAKWDESIISLRDNDKIFVGRYQSTDKTIYSYALNTQFGKRPLKLIESENESNVYVNDVLDNPSDSKLSCWRHEFTNKWLQKQFNFCSEENYWFVFTVPKGTFKEDFNVDQQ